MSDTDTPAFTSSAWASAACDAENTVSAPAFNAESRSFSKSSADAFATAPTPDIAALKSVDVLTAARPMPPIATAVTPAAVPRSDTTVLAPDPRADVTDAPAFFAPPATSEANFDMSPRTSTHTVPACAMSHLRFAKNALISSGVAGVRSSGGKDAPVLGLGVDLTAGEGVVADLSANADDAARRASATRRNASRRSGSRSPRRASPLRSWPSSSAARMSRTACDSGPR